MKYGYFDNGKREYVIDRVDVPVSWTNYLGVEDLCAVVNHTAGGYLFYKTPEYHRITRFRGNSVPMDRPGHYVYIRDNEDTKPRDLSLFSYCEFSFHHINIDNQNFQMSLYCSGSSYEDEIIAYDLFYEECGYQYFTSNVMPDGFDCLRDRFIGSYRTEDKPEAVELGRCSASHELGNNRCGSLQRNIRLMPGEEARILFLLGEGDGEAGRKAREKYGDWDKVDKVYEDLRRFWDAKLGKLQIRTPNEGMSTLINIWTLYQSEINVMFSRFASFIELGGRVGLGYRDTVQDAMTVPHSNPGKCRQRIIGLLRGLVSDGYGLHLFQPEWFEPDPWAWAAECRLGRGDKAMKYYNALCPYWQNDKIEIREAEPYSYCQFIMGKDHSAHGRARHPFMTGRGGELSMRSK